MNSDKKSKTFYITTTLPYVNAEPHIGFALEIIQADVLARFQRAAGKEVFFNTGADEHGIKIYRKALELRQNPQVYVDKYAAHFSALKNVLNLSYTKFIRTTDPEHKKAAQEFWKRCEAKGDIYKKNYKIKYCVGCELEKTDSELKDGHCFLHPNLDMEEIAEENYFFKFSAYQQKLLDLYKSRSNFVVPDSRFNEIKSFVSQGLNDFSISRLKSKMPWGVCVPEDEEQVMYVWFDALINYISALGWPKDKINFEKFWPGVQVAGKDNLRQQSAMWQAMLMSAGLPCSHQIFIHGFITADGQKMSKSLGNVVDPLELVKKYGTDAVRFYLLREIPSYDDGDFSYAKFEERYNGDLANGLGNLVARISAIGEKISPAKFYLEKDLELFLKEKIAEVQAEYGKKMEDIRLNESLASAWSLIGEADRYINEKKPWSVKDGENLRKIIFNAGYLVHQIAVLLSPFLPDTSEKIKKTVFLENGKLIFKKREHLFNRLEK